MYSQVFKNKENKTKISHEVYIFVIKIVLLHENSPQAVSYIYTINIKLGKKWN